MSEELSNSKQEDIIKARIPNAASLLSALKIAACSKMDQCYLESSTSFSLGPAANCIVPRFVRSCMAYNAEKEYRAILSSISGAVLPGYRLPNCRSLPSWGILKAQPSVTASWVHHLCHFRGWSFLSKILHRFLSFSFEPIGEVADCAHQVSTQYSAPHFKDLKDILGTLHGPLYVAHFILNEYRQKLINHLFTLHFIAKQRAKTSSQCSNFPPFTQG